MRRRERLIKNIQKARKYRSVPRQLVDLVIYKLKIHTYWEDYYNFGFYRGDKSWAERALYVGYSGSRYWPWEGNSLKFDRLFIRKTLQKSVLIAHGLPTPKFIMKCGEHYAINTREKFAREMEKISVPIVTKFDGGGGGVGNYSLKPEAGRFRFRDDLVDSDWIWNQYKDSMDSGFLVEERVANHPVMDELHPSSLNCLRLNTVKTADGLWHQLRPSVRMGRGGSHLDGLSVGGLFAGIDDDGRMGIAYSKSGETFEEHPDTGARIKGRDVPYFDEAVALARKASQTFGFMATIGWDVGLTPDGPMILEGNPFWDPRDIQDQLGPFLSQEVALGLIPRYWWSSWDKTHMYPDYMKDQHGGWWQRHLARRRRRWNSRLKEKLAQASE